MVNKLKEKFIEDVENISKELAKASNEELYEAYRDLVILYKKKHSVNHTKFIKGYFKESREVLFRRFNKQKHYLNIIIGRTNEFIILFEVTDGTLIKPVLVTSEEELVEIYNKYSNYNFS